MNDFSPWPWHDSLGGISAEADGAFRVRRILFGVVKDRCRELGLEEGDTIRCRRKDHDGVEIELSSGDRKRMDLTHAWFIEVEPVPGEAVAGRE